MNWTKEMGLWALKKMQARTSIRSFADKPIEKELMEEILKAALQAPSGGNLQPITVINITDEKKRTKMMEMCGNQKFIGEAPVNLLFFVDWHKMEIFAKHEKAPFTCRESYMHFLIAVEDVMCMAQIVETAAHLVGLGSCYVGSVNNLGDEIAEVFNMPKGSYPVVMLSLGYPTREMPIREKLSKDIMIFENSYPGVDEEHIVREYRLKYGDMSTTLPDNEAVKAGMLENLKDALYTSYPKDEAEKILKEVMDKGKMNETQRRFGLHYHARKMQENGKQIIERMERHGLKPFEM
ncbi:MAG: nitroreductase family protein [Defluviitaleaceae bacterium]|nr:nitroreductase family protein [Defluviitaleaceae bacterium]